MLNYLSDALLAVSMVVMTVVETVALMVVMLAADLVD